MDTSRGHGRIEATLLDRCPDDQPAIRPRDHVDALSRDDPLAGRLGGGTAQRQDLALDGADWRPRLGRQPLDLTGPAARGQDQSGRPKAAAIGRLQGPGPIAPLGRDDGGTTVNGNLSAVQGAEEGRDHAARVDARLAWNVRASAHAGGEPRLDLPAGPAGQPLRAEAEPPVKLVATAEALGLVAIERHMQRAVLREADLELRVPLEPLAEAGPAAQRLEVQ